MEDSRIPLRHWAYALWKACSSKKGVSALQIKRETGLTYKSALFMMHRIRFGMAEDWRAEPKLSGIVEADETYVGGKPRNKQKGKGPQKGWLQTRKTPVVSLVQRGGNIRSFVTADVTSNNLARILRENLTSDTHLMTDSSVVYRSHVIQNPVAKHDMTNHRAAGCFAWPVLSCRLRHCRCQLAPPSEVAKLCPPAVVIVAYLALLADTPFRLSVLGPLMSSQCSPSVVRMIVPLRPTIQHTVADGADAATRSVLTPLC